MIAMGNPAGTQLNRPALAATRRMAGFPATVAMAGPGVDGREGTAGALIFDAGASMQTLDLMTRFLSEDGPALDWLSDFLCDPATDHLVRDLAESSEEDEFEELHYSKSELATLGSGEIYL